MPAHALGQFRAAFDGHLHDLDAACAARRFHRPIRETSDSLTCIIRNGCTQELLAVDAGGLQAFLAAAGTAFAGNVAGFDERRPAVFFRGSDCCRDFRSCVVEHKAAGIEDADRIESVFQPIALY